MITKSVVQVEIIVKVDTYPALRRRTLDVGQRPCALPFLTTSDAHHAVHQSDPSGDKHTPASPALEAPT